MAKATVHSAFHAVFFVANDLFAGVWYVTFGNPAGATLWFSVWVFR